MQPSVSPVKRSRSSGVRSRRFRIEARKFGAYSVIWSISRSATDSRTRREAEPRPQLFGDGRAADVGKALEHHDPQAGSSQIGGGDQAVMPGAYDNDIRIHPASPSRSPLLPGPSQRNMFLLRSRAVGS